MGKQQRHVPAPGHPDHREGVARAVLSMQAKTSPHGKFTLSWVIADFQGHSSAWRANGPKTRTDKAALYSRMEKAWGTFDMRTLTSVDLAQIMDTVPANTTHNRMKTLWGELFRHAISRGWLKEDLSKTIQRRKTVTTHTHIWTDAERAKFEAHWPTGSRPRLAYALQFETRQACADVSHMGRRNEDDGMMTGERVKTGGRYTVVISDALEREIAPHRSLTTYILTSAGNPYSERGLHNALSGWINEAGLPDRCTPHGLRGAGLTKDAENGATEKELMNAGGFKNAADVQIYIREANRRTLAKSVNVKRLAGDKE